MPADSRQALIEDVVGELRRSTVWRRTWSGLYHGATVLSIVSHVLALLFLQLTAWSAYKSVAVVFAGVATILSVSSIALGFGKRWRLMAEANSGLRELQISLQDPSYDEAQARSELQRILKEWSRGISAARG